MDLNNFLRSSGMEINEALHEALAQIVLQIAKDMGFSFEMAVGFGIGVEATLLRIAKHGIPEDLAIILMGLHEIAPPTIELSPNIEQLLNDILEDDNDMYLPYVY